MEFSKKIRQIPIVLIIVIGIVMIIGSGGGGGGGGEDSGNTPKGKNSGTITGYVTDKDDQPLSIVSVSAYGQTTETDSAGNFNLTEVTIPSDRIVVNFQKEGFFNNSIGAVPSQNGNTNIRVVLIAREKIGTVDNASGGEVKNSDISVSVEEGSFIGTDGSQVDGDVSIYGAYVNPEDENFGSQMPGGDFSATNEENDEGILESFGAVIVEAEKENKEQVQLTKNANMCIAIPASLLSAAPDTIPLWRMNTSTAKWEEIGTAEKNGNQYCFTTLSTGGLNCDLFNRTAILKGTVCDNGSPRLDAEVKVGQLSTITNENGEYSMLVSSGEALNLETLYGVRSVCPIEAGTVKIADLGCNNGDDEGDDGCINGNQDTYFIWKGKNYTSEINGATGSADGTITHGVDCLPVLYENNNYIRVEVYTEDYSRHLSSTTNPDAFSKADKTYVVLEIIDSNGDLVSLFASKSGNIRVEIFSDYNVYYFEVEMMACTMGADGYVATGSPIPLSGKIMAPHEDLFGY